MQNAGKGTAKTVHSDQSIIDQEAVVVVVVVKVEVVRSERREAEPCKWTQQEAGKFWKGAMVH